MAPEQVQYYFQLSQLQQQQQQQPGSTAASSTPQVAQLPPGAHIIQQANGQVIIAAQPHQIAALGNANNVRTLFCLCFALKVHLHKGSFACHWQKYSIFVLFGKLKNVIFFKYLGENLHRKLFQIYEFENKMSKSKYSILASKFK